MLVTLEGMTMLEREPQSLNALSPMLVTLEGITTSDREPQPVLYVKKLSPLGWLN